MPMMSKQFKKSPIKHGLMYMGNSFCGATRLYVKSLYSKEVLLDNMLHKGHHFILASEGAICWFLLRFSMII
jgi:hypothetical protein